MLLTCRFALSITYPRQDTIHALYPIFNPFGRQSDANTSSTIPHPRLPTTSATQPRRKCRQINGRTTANQRKTNETSRYLPKRDAVPYNVEPQLAGTQTTPRERGTRHDERNRGKRKLNENVRKNERKGTHVPVSWDSRCPQCLPISPYPPLPPVYPLDSFDASKPAEQRLYKPPTPQRAERIEGARDT
ncbi:hypothetical protein AB1N83_013554 [Pleurotus pulmonarius]